MGKTTVAAALALARALDGGRALVCTIDPARRLANALGLDGARQRRGPRPGARLAGGGPRAARASCFAMMLDVKRTWDELVARHAPDPARRDRILGNRLYQQMSAALAGSQEYMAMEKLYELATDRDYDLIVLDTPPTAHALDFLDAPARILDFLGNDAARALPRPGAGRRAGRVPPGAALRRLRGQDAGALHRASRRSPTSASSCRASRACTTGFKDAGSRGAALLAGPDVGFVLVTLAQPRLVEEALAFHERLPPRRCRSPAWS